MLTIEKFPSLNLDPTLTLDDMMGFMDWVNSDIAPAIIVEGGLRDKEGKGSWVGLARFHRGIYTYEIISELKEAGCCPIASFEEISAFGEVYPDKQRRYPIVALGIVLEDPSDSCLVVPVLERDSRGRTMDLDFYDQSWGEGENESEPVPRFLIKPEIC